MREHLTAKNGWAAMAIGVTAFEIACPRGETLSEGVDRFMERSRMARVGATVLGAVTLAHLLNVIPEHRDPFHYALLWKHYE